MRRRLAVGCLVNGVLIVAVLLQSIYIWTSVGQCNDSASSSIAAPATSPTLTELLAPSPRPTLPVALDAAAQAQEHEWDLESYRQRLKRTEWILKELVEEQAATRRSLEDVMWNGGQAAFLTSEKSDRGKRPEKVPCICRDMSGMAQGRPWCSAQKQSVSGAHVCSFVNSTVCLVSGPNNTTRLHFRLEGSPVPIVTIQGEVDRTNMTPITVAGVSGFGIRTYQDGPLWMSLRRAPLLPGTTVLYSSKFFAHPTHVLEGAGSLHLATNEETRRYGAGLANSCEARNPFCLGRIERFVSLGGTILGGSWHENTLRILLGDVDKAIRFEHDVDLMRTTDRSEPPAVCFEKAVVPGFYYSIFPDTESTEPFQANVRTYLERHAGMPSNRTARNRPRKILLSKRTTKRRVVDWDVLEYFVRSLASAVTEATGVDVSVEVVEFGLLSFEQQATAAASADILMGMHGADLTNVMFMRRGSVLIELNPVFFFENRFFEIANNLGVHYMAWTCTHEDCAFGGSMRQRFRSIAAQAQYEKNTRTMEWQGERFVWPADRPVGLSCPHCNALVSRGGPLYGGFMQFRDSDIRVSGSLREIQSVMNNAMVKLQWIVKAK